LTFRKQRLYGPRRSPREAGRENERAGSHRAPGGEAVLPAPKRTTRPDLDPSGALLLRVEPTDFTTHRSAAPAAASSRVGPIEKRSIRSAGTPADNYMEE